MLLAENENTRGLLVLIISAGYMMAQNAPPQHAVARAMALVDEVLKHYPNLDLTE